MRWHAWSGGQEWVEQGLVGSLWVLVDDWIRRQKWSEKEKWIKKNYFCVVQPDRNIRQIRLKCLDSILLGSGQSLTEKNY